MPAAYGAKINNRSRLSLWILLHMQEPVPLRTDITNSTSGQKELVHLVCDTSTYNPPLTFSGAFPERMPRSLSLI